MKKFSKGKLICFIGVDGSGKTTISREVARILRERGIKCKHTYGRLQPFILRPLTVVARKLITRKSGKDYKAYKKEKIEAVKKMKILSKLYTTILLVDYYIQLFVRVKLPLLFGRVVICDRYVYDTVINDIPLESDDINTIESWINCIFNFAPKPDIVFLIDVPEEISMMRKNDIPSIEYIRERRDTYLALSRRFGMVVMDGTKDLEELKCEILKKI
jgi:dTMP kinase